MIKYEVRKRILDELASDETELAKYAEIVRVLNRDYGICDTEMSMLVYDIVTRYIFGECVFE